MAPKKSGKTARPQPAARPIRSGTVKQRTSGARPAVRPSTLRAGGGSKSVRPAKPVLGAATSTKRPSRREPAGEVVLGSVPTASRVIGAAGVFGGLLLAIAVPLPYLQVGDQQLVVGASLLTIVGSVIWPAAIVAAGVSVIRGRYPRLGLAVLGVAGAISVSGLFAHAYWATSAAARGRYEVIAGRRLLTTSVEPLSGWYVALAGLVVLIACALAVGWVWPRVVMDDSQSLDPGRPLLGGLAAVCGVTALLSLSVGLLRIPDEVTVSQELIAGQLRPIETVVPVEGAVGLFDRPGLALSASLLLGVLLVLFSIFGTTLRPRLAVVGALAAFALYVLTVGVRALLEAGRSEQLTPSVGAWGLVLAGAGYAGVTMLAWHWQPPARSASRGLPMRPATRRALKNG